MPNYKSSFLWFPNVAAMTSFLVDNTDEDGLMFAVGIDNTQWRLAVWRKYSTTTVDNINVFPANGIGRWIMLQSAIPTLTPFSWNSSDVNMWNSSDVNQWNTAIN